MPRSALAGELEAARSWLDSKALDKELRTRGLEIHSKMRRKEPEEDRQRGSVGLNNLQL